LNRHQKPLQHRIKTPAYRRAFERLDDALERNSSFSNAAKIQLIRQAYFADVDALEKSGRIIIPK